MQNILVTPLFFYYAYNIKGPFLYFYYFFFYLLASNRNFVRVDLRIKDQLTWAL